MLEQSFVIEKLHNVFVRDSTKETHALSHEVNSPTEIDEMFGTISYAKGASIMRMLQHLIGYDHFLAALTKYLDA